MLSPVSRNAARRAAFAALLLGLGAVAAGAVRAEAPAQTFDLLIRNGRVLDGSGNPWVRADVGIRDGRIAAVGPLPGAHAKRVIDARDLYVAPGFIDVHSHAGEGILRPGAAQAQPLLVQGVTTAVVNPDGGGPVDLAAQRASLEKAGPGVNLALMIGHGSVRRAVLGMADRAASADELEAMKRLVRRGMDEGAFGLSSGLFYAPGSYAKTDEVVELMRVAAERGGLHSSHVRDEGMGGNLLQSVDEIIRVASETGTTGVVTHFKALGPDSWGLSAAGLARIERARQRGVVIFADQYPYDASSTSLAAAVLPRWSQAGGEPELRKRLADPPTRQRLLVEVKENIRRRGEAASLVLVSGGAGVAGQSLEAIARARRVSAEEAALALVAHGSPQVISFNMSEADIERIMQQPWTMTSSDGELPAASESQPHPRSYGAFARKLSRYVRERGTIGFESAIRSMTSLPALVFGLRGRGVLREGAFADVVVFDLAAVRDTATYEHPRNLAQGMSYVVVNGTLAVDGGKLTAAHAGRVLRKGD